MQDREFYNPVDGFPQKWKKRLMWIDFLAIVHQLAIIHCDDRRIIILTAWHQARPLLGL